MKIRMMNNHVSLSLMALALALAGAGPALGSAPPLTGALLLRPLTATEIAKTNYALPSTTERSGGLNTVGVGTAVYLDAVVNIAIPQSDIVGVTWALTNLPPNSTAAILTNSPLGTNVPVYNPADALVLEVAGRALFRADVTGQYTIVATITTASEGTTNVAQTITAADYMGVATCELCHSGGAIAQNIYDNWVQTPHATFFSNAVDGYLTSHYGASCIQCHTVGFDTNPLANDGGFDDVATTNGWKFPSVLSPTNYASMPAALQNLSSIQCENCHGPGSEHAYNLGDTNKISVAMAAGDCSQCHDDLNTHVKSAEWQHSVHAITTTDPAGSASCVGCHTAWGFAGRELGQTNVNTAYEAITCQACHDPHVFSNPNQLRPQALASATLMDGTVVTNGGVGTLCMQCHMSRQNATNYVVATAGSSHYGPHHGPQADMLEGVNGITYGNAVGSSPHKDCVPDTCVTCHMQTVATGAPGYLNVGDHTFEVAWAGAGTNGPVQLTAVCQQCHGPITTFNFPTVDYDGDGVVEGVQDEVRNLMNKLAILLPPVGVAKTNLAIDSTWTKQQLKAAYNYLFVQSDGSYGVHNIAYTVDLLKGSIADLNGGPNDGGLPNSWQLEYFGSTSNPSAQPDASPAGDGVPNWLKFALGLDPTVPGIELTNGVVWANGSAQISAGNTNAIQIFTAAEVVFTTDKGTNYQLQGISSLSEGWQNVGAPILGTGDSMSFLTPTRNDAMQFYRVIHNP